MNVEWAGKAYRRLGFGLASLLFFILLNVVVYLPALLQSSTRVVTRDGSDMVSLVIPLRTFALDELRQGRLALWNPYVFCGYPSFGGFQVATLYPPNWLMMALPTGWAINLSIVLHVTLAGWFCCLWVRSRGLHAIACLLAGVLFSYSGGLLFHLSEGHLMVLSVIAWAPLVMLCIEKVFAGGGIKPVLLGGLAIALMVFGGHPQSVYYTGIAAGLYSLLRLIVTPGRLRAIGLLAAMGAVGVSLSLVQIWHGFEVVAESSRAGGVSIQFAGEASLPPDNLITLVAPRFYGNVDGVPYWGHARLNTGCMFLGAAGLLLAVYGAMTGTGAQRRFSFAIAFVMLILALGEYSPLFRFLYEHVPGFNSNRDNARFNLQFSLFMSMLAAVGLNAIIEGKWSAKFAGYGFAAVAALLLVTASVILGSGGSGQKGWWGQFLLWYIDTPIDRIADDLVAKMARASGWRLVYPGLVAAVVAGIVLLSRRWPRLAYGTAAVCVVEMAVFANSLSGTAEYRLPSPQAWRGLDTLKDPDWRRCHAQLPFCNLGAINRQREMYGYDPVILKRYSNLLSFSQGQDYTQQFYVPGISRVSPVFRLMGLKVIFYFENGSPQLTVLEDTVPRLQLMTDWKIVTDRLQQVQILCDPRFKPTQTVLLETPPVPTPKSGPVKGFAKVVRETSDEVEIEAELDKPAILLINDSYSQYWTAKPLIDGSQPSYQVLPADCAFRGIPLAAGKHRFLMAFTPPGFMIGRWISLAALVVWLAAVAWTLLRRRPTHNSPPEEAK